MASPDLAAHSTIHNAEVLTKLSTSIWGAFDFFRFWALVLPVLEPMSINVSATNVANASIFSDFEQLEIASYWAYCKLLAAIFATMYRSEFTYFLWVNFPISWLIFHSSMKATHKSQVNMYTYSVWQAYCLTVWVKLQSIARWFFTVSTLATSTPAIYIVIHSFSMFFSSCQIICNIKRWLLSTLSLLIPSYL